MKLALLLILFAGAAFSSLDEKVDFTPTVRTEIMRGLAIKFPDFSSPLDIMEVATERCAAARRNGDWSPALDLGVQFASWEALWIKLSTGATKPRIGKTVLDQTTVTVGDCYIRYLTVQMRIKELKLTDTEVEAVLGREVKLKFGKYMKAHEAKKYLGTWPR